MSTSINVHDVVSLAIGPVEHSGQISWRDVNVTDKQGHTFTLTLYAERAEQLADVEEDAKLTAAYAEGRADQLKERQ